MRCQPQRSASRTVACASLKELPHLLRVHHRLSAALGLRAEAQGLLNELRKREGEVKLRTCRWGEGWWLGCRAARTRSSSALIAASSALMPPSPSPAEECVRKRVGSVRLWTARRVGCW